MGRHEAYTPTFSRRIQRLTNWLVAKLPFELPKIPRLKPHAFRPAFGFLFATGFLMVTIVDPYSGTMASADTIQVYDQETANPEQTYGYASTQRISFARGGFNIVTGDDAASMFVETADLPTPGTAKAYAYQVLQGMGFGEDQYSCLVKLWDRESNWRIQASNSNSGAYGIPQALPGSKMASEGADWMTNPETQIRWGAKYIKGRYGSPCGALAHSDKIGWY